MKLDTTCIAGALLQLATACSDATPSSQTCAGIELELHPRIASVFVASEIPTDPVGSPYSMTYGFNSFANQCEAVSDCADVAGVSCTKGCAGSTETPGNCLYPAGQTPIATDAIARASTPTRPGSSIHLVFEDLPDGATVEAIACACRAHGTCVGGAAVTLDYTDCSVCGDSPETAEDETGKCVDANGDGLPDEGVLFAGSISIVCGSFLTYTNVEGEGEYVPSGNSFPSSLTGFAGIGPHIALEPSVDLPTNTDCEVHFASTIRTKKNEPFVANDGPMRFHTESLAALSVVAARGSATVIFNVGVRAAGTQVVVADAAGHAVAATTTTFDGADAHLVFAAPLLPGTTYNVTVAAAADSYGRPLPAPAHLTFVAP